VKSNILSVAAVFLTAAATVFVRNAVGALSEPPDVAQPDERSAIHEEGDRCPLQLDVTRMENISSGDVTLDYQGRALRIRIKESNDALDMLGFDRRVPYLELGRFEFSDASLCTGDLVDRGFDLVGTEESEIILGTNATDRIRGKQGNDTLDGGEGDDVYVFDRGDGLDCIQDASGHTTISFGKGIAPQDLLIAEENGPVGQTLFLRVLSANGALASEGLNFRTGSPLEFMPPDFRFSDGSMFTLSELHRVAQRGDLKAWALARDRVCYFDAPSATRAGVPNKRSQSPTLPALPAPEIMIPYKNTIVAPGKDGRPYEVTECIVSESGERRCH